MLILRSASPRATLYAIRQVVNDALASLDAEFEVLYTDFGRPRSRWRG
jgi:hypothetical protein